MYLTEDQYNHILKEEVKVLLLQDIDERLEDGFHVRGKKDQYVIMKWSYYLELIKTFGENVAKFDTDYTSIISKTLNLENINNKFELTKADKDFYHKTKLLMKMVHPRAKDELQSKLNLFKTSRLNLICSFASSRPLSEDIEDKLTYEEVNVYRTIRAEIEKFNESLKEIFLE